MQTSCARREKQTSFVIEPPITQSWSGAEPPSYISSSIGQQRQPAARAFLKASERPWHLRSSGLEQSIGSLAIAQVHRSAETPVLIQNEPETIKAGNLQQAQ
jgi:hypothetical protein